MATYSTRQAARKLGIGMTTLTRHIENGKVPAPKSTIIGRYEIRAWTEDDIDRVRALLPKVRNGRKTRYQKLREKQAHARAAPPRPGKTGSSRGPGPALQKSRKGKKDK